MLKNKDYKLFFAIKKGSKAKFIAVDDDDDDFNNNYRSTSRKYDYYDDDDYDF